MYPRPPLNEEPVVPNSREGKSEAAFQKALNFTLKHEGGYVNHSKDPGGETKFGISKASYPRENIKDLTKERAAELYRKDYWNKMKASDMPEPIAMLAFDMAINHGVSRATKMIQKVVGAKTDGIVGKKTLKKISQSFNNNPISLIDRIVEGRRDFYRSLRTYETFGRGWDARAIATSTEAKSIFDGEI